MDGLSVDELAALAVGTVPFLAELGTRLGLIFHRDAFFGPQLFFSMGETALRIREEVPCQRRGIPYACCSTCTSQS